MYIYTFPTSVNQDAYNFVIIFEIKAKPYTKKSISSTFNWFISRILIKFFL
jgi:hypothetical protein